MSHREDDDCIEIPVKIPTPWLRKWAGHLITVFIMCVLTAFSSWLTQLTISKNHENTTTAISTNQTQIDEMKDEIQDLRQLNKDCKASLAQTQHDLGELKRILGIRVKGDVTIYSPPPGGGFR